MLGLSPWLLGTAILGAAPVIVIPLDTDTARSRSLPPVDNLEFMLTPLDIFQRLTGGRAPSRAPDIEELELRLAHARNLEAEFDSNQANEIRQSVLRQFDATARPHPQFRKLAASMAVDLAQSLIHEDKATASEAFAPVVRHFYVERLDPERFSPDVVRMYEQALAAKQQEQRGIIRISSDAEHPHIIVDAIDMGFANQQREVHLPFGAYRVWLASSEGQSFPRKVVVGPRPVMLHFDLTTEQRLQLDWDQAGQLSSITLQCESDCAEPLRHIASSVGVSRIVGFRRGVPGEPPEILELEVDLVGSPSTFSQAGMSPSGPLERPRFQRFSPWYLLPFGGGQFAQQRHVAGAAYAALQVGFIAWYASAQGGVDNAQKRGDIRKEQSLGEQANMSLALAAGIAVFSVTEALVVGLISGDN